MPKNVVVFFLPEHDEWPLIFDQNMYNKVQISGPGPVRQVVTRQLTQTNYSQQKPASATFSKRVTTLFRSRGTPATLTRKYQASIEVDPQAVAGAYRFLSRCYEDGDKIILIGIARLPEDSSIIRLSMAELTKHLNNGTEPPAPLTTKAVNAVERFEPETSHPNLLARRQVPTSCVALIHYSEGADPTSFNNGLLDQYPLSVERFVSINYAPKEETMCDTVREPSGGIKSRDVWYFDEPMWQPPFILYSTMGFIHYHPRHTQQWDNIQPISARTATVTLSPPPMGRRYSIQGNPNPTFNGDITSLSPTNSSSSLSTTVMHPDTTPGTTPRTSSVANFPLMSPGYVTQPPGVNTLEVFAYKAFRRSEHDDHLPPRVLWRARRMEAVAA